jgi:hypothetical protein
MISDPASQFSGKINQRTEQHDQVEKHPQRKARLADGQERDIEKRLD